MHSFQARICLQYFLHAIVYAYNCTVTVVYVCKCSFNINVSFTITNFGICKNRSNGFMFLLKHFATVWFFEELLGFLCAIGMFEQYTLMSSFTAHNIDCVKGFSCLDLIY